MGEVQARSRGYPGIALVKRHGKLGESDSKTEALAEQQTTPTRRRHHTRRRNDFEKLGSCNTGPVERRNPHPHKEVRRRQLPTRTGVCNCALKSIVRRSGSRAHSLVAAGTHSDEGDAPGVGCRTRLRLPNEARRSPAWGPRLGGYRPNSRQRSPAHASGLVAVRGLRAGAAGTSRTGANHLRRDGEKRRVSRVWVRKPAPLARGRPGNIHRYIQVGRMQIFHVDSQPLVKACSIQIDLLVLADRCGEAENFLKLVGVLLHRSAILTDVGEHAKGVSPEARSEAKVASLLEVPPRDGRIFQLQAKVPCLRHTGKMKCSQAHELPGRGVLCLKELLATMEPGRRILTPIKAWELQSGELRRRRGRDVRQPCCLRLLGRKDDSRAGCRSHQLLVLSRPAAAGASAGSRPALST
nr:hypothetical protein Iba_chr11cCG9770 [Ipomoea batatas]